VVEKISPGLGLYLHLAPEQLRVSKEESIEAEVAVRAHTIIDEDDPVEKK